MVRLEWNFSIMWRFMSISKITSFILISHVFIWKNCLYGASSPTENDAFDGLTIPEIIARKGIILCYNEQPAQLFVLATTRENDDFYPYQINTLNPNNHQMFTFGVEESLQSPNLMRGYFRGNVMSFIVEFAPFPSGQRPHRELFLPIPGNPQNVEKVTEFLNTLQL